MKRILIIGRTSYIGTSLMKYLSAPKYHNEYLLESISVRDDSWKQMDFSSYDVIFMAAGKAHADVGTVSEEVKREYYAVNCELARAVAEKAKRDKVKQFIYPSSIIIYGESAPYGKVMMITQESKPAPANFYGDSKWQGDQAITRLNGTGIKTAVLRLPMIYGRGSKGNYPILAKLARKLPVFPGVRNTRSMLYIGNLCECIRQIIDYEDEGIFYPQNAEYTTTSQMVEAIAQAAGKKIKVTKILNPFVTLASHTPGKIGRLVNKAFGNCAYAKELSEYRGNSYQKYSLKESIDRTERTR